MKQNQDTIKIIGVGGGGNNIVNEIAQYFIRNNLNTSALIAMNTDAQALAICDPAVTTLQLGEDGQGAGSKPERGREAADYSRNEIIESIGNTKLVLLCACLGGGTGSGSTPEIARIAKEQNCIVIAVLITPFACEGNTRMKIAEDALKEIEQHVDTYVVVSNEQLISIKGVSQRLRQLFAHVNKLCIEFITNMFDILKSTGHINLDYSDIVTAVHNKGPGFIGIGFARGANAIVEATRIAFDNPLLQAQNITKASNGLVYVVGNAIMMNEVNTMAEEIYKVAGKDVFIKMGFRECDDNGSKYDGVDDDSDWAQVMILLTGTEKEIRPIEKSNATFFNFDR